MRESDKEVKATEGGFRPSFCPLDVVITYPLNELLGLPI